MRQLCIRAGGIQVLAALVGLSATDSVGTSTVDYSIGSIAPRLHSRSSDCWDGSFVTLRRVAVGRKESV